MRSCGLAPSGGAYRASAGVLRAPLDDIDFPPRPTSAEAIDPSARPLTGDVRAQAPSEVPFEAPSITSLASSPAAAADDDDPRNIMRRAWLAHSQAPAADPPGIRSASCRPCTSSQTTLLSPHGVGRDLMPSSASVKGPKARVATPSPSCAVDAHEAPSATPLLPVRSLRTDLSIARHAQHTEPDQYRMRPQRGILAGRSAGARRAPRDADVAAPGPTSRGWRAQEGNCRQPGDHNRPCDSQLGSGPRRVYDAIQPNAVAWACWRQVTAARVGIYPAS